MIEVVPDEDTYAGNEERIDHPQEENAAHEGNEEEGDAPGDPSESCDDDDADDDYEDAQSMVTDAATLDTLAEKRATEVMQNAPRRKRQAASSSPSTAPGASSSSVTLGVLERFLPSRKVSGAQERTTERTEIDDIGTDEEFDVDDSFTSSNSSFEEPQRPQKSKQSFRVKVPESFAYVVERRGKRKNQRVLSSGRYTLMPIMDRVVRVHSLRVEPMVIPAARVFTKDPIPIHTGGLLFVQITDALKAFGNPYRSLLMLAQACISNVIGRHLLRTAAASRAQLGKTLVGEINETAHEWGLKVSRVELTQLVPPRETQAMLLIEAESRLQVANARSNRQLDNIYETHNITETNSEILELETLLQRERNGNNNGNKNNEHKKDSDCYDDAISLASATTWNDPFLDDDQEVLGKSWFSGATANTRRTLTRVA